jgi:hypothetical protein
MVDILTWELELFSSSLSFGPTSWLCSYDDALVYFSVHRKV